MHGPCQLRGGRFPERRPTACDIRSHLGQLAARTRPHIRVISGIRFAPRAVMLRALALCAGSLHFIGCAGGVGEPPPRTTRTTPQPEVAASAEATAPRAACPAEAPATWVGAQELRRGGALVFTTSDEHIAELRVRVSSMPWPSALESVDPHLDNIRRGVRVVFESRDPADVPALRKAVTEHARSIAKTCGLALALRTDAQAEPTRSEAASARVTTAHAAPSALVVPGLSPKAQAKPMLRVDTKLKLTPPATSGSSTPAQPPGKFTPPNRLEPKPGDKPGFPRLPGVRPDPIRHG